MYFHDLVKSTLPEGYLAERRRAAEAAQRKQAAATGPHAREIVELQGQINQKELAMRALLEQAGNDYRPRTLSIHEGEAFDALNAEAAELRSKIRKLEDAS
jgi:hypothetical protein